MRYFSLLLVLLAFGIDIDAQVETSHGTILIYEQNQSPSQVIVVADSRVASATRRPKSACKIVVLGEDTISFYSGNLFEGVEDKTGKTVFSQRDTASEAFTYFDKMPRSEERLVNLAQKYSELVRPRIEKIFAQMARTDSARSIGLTGFASLDEHGQPRIVQVNIPVVVPNDGVSPVYLGPTDYSEPPSNKWIMSNPALAPYKEVNEFLFANTTRGKRARDAFDLGAVNFPERDREARLLVAAAKASIDWNNTDPYIGLPIDAVVIEPQTGIRWIAAKPKCKTGL